MNPAAKSMDLTSKWPWLILNAIPISAKIAEIIAK
jgi:hypothetical protein